MFSFGDLFNWDRFITPAIIRMFYWLAIGLVVLGGLSGIFSALAMMAVNPFAGVAGLIAALLFVLVGIMAARIAAEFVLIVFRINENLDAIRQRGGM
jgi:nicotinamide riboside transporter PnuC